MSQITHCLIKNTDPAQEIADSILDSPAIMFSGQGSQTAGMGRDIAEADRDAMNFWIEAEKISGLPLREIYWEGEDEARNDTRAVQPALTVTNLNIWNSFSKRNPGMIPQGCAGHSLGEFAALAAAGVLTPKAALEITSLRGRLMAEADPEGVGSMAAIVKLDENTVGRIVEEVGAETGELIVPANYNTPAQTIVSGTKKAVDAAIAKARLLKGKGLTLNVSGAFHSPMMEDANRELKPLLEKTDWANPRIPFYSNLDGKQVKSGEAAKKSILRQMISPVFWVNLVRNLYLAGIRWWMEISPRAVLGKMIGPSLAGIAGQCDSLRVDIISSLNHIMNYAL